MSDLYEPWVIEHSQSPHNHRELPDCTHSCRKSNALCGDRIAVHLKVTHGIIEEATFQGRACAVAMATSSRLTQHITGIEVAQARVLAAAAQAATIAGGMHTESDLDYLHVLREHTSRQKCALLAWDALLSALDQGDA